MTDVKTDSAARAVSSSPDPSLPSSDGPMAGSTADTPKIACRSVWKVYGPDADKRFAELHSQLHSQLHPQLHPQQFDSEQLRQTLLEEGFIVAAADVSFDVQPGEIFIIMGLSGSGKSTMVRCLSRLVEPTGGEVLLDGEDFLAANDAELINIRRHRMGMVFQNFGLMPHLTVLENISFPLKLQGMPTKQRNACAREVLELVGLQGRENSFPRQLSGGQQQRVGIARSLAVEPDVWLLDEPFSALDPLIRRQMQDEFLRLQTILNKTIVFITHDFLEALRLADRIAIMKDGLLVQLGTPTELVLNPANDYVAEFTKDVPRDRVITVGELVDPHHSQTLPNTPSIADSTTLNNVMPLFESHPNGVQVTRDEQIIGVVTPAMVIQALAQHQS